METEEIIPEGGGRFYTIPNCSSTPAKPKSLIEWAEENLIKIEVQDCPIADTGDHGSLWIVEDCDNRKSYGETLESAILDAQKDDEDPTRSDYVPPEFR